MTTILVVEDTQTDAQVIAGTLRQGGFTAITVTSSEAAKSEIAQQKPDAIVLDVVLPGISGFELCRELKAHPHTSDIPIVLCSTKDGEMDKFWGMKQGAASYLTKPVNPEELLRTVKFLTQA